MTPSPSPLFHTPVELPPDWLLDGQAGRGRSVDAQAHLDSVEDTLRQISEAIAHDLRTSLRHVTSYTELLSERVAADPAEAVRLAKKVAESGRQLQQLLDAMAALARVERLRLRPQRLDMAEMVRAVQLQLAAPGEGLASVRWQVDPDWPAVQADPLLLRQVWTNLLRNALRFSATAVQPAIHVGWQALPGGVAFYVRDNGCGFEEQHAARLFGLFQRLHVGTRAPAGALSGLGAGLALVRRIVACHGGRVWASSRTGEGATFGFMLPTRAQVKNSVGTDSQKPG